MTETPEELAGLAFLWDKQNLLYIHSYDIPSYYPEERVRIFGAMKDADRDRQIGDKRGRNFAEGKVDGPSIAACRQLQI